MVSVVLSRDPMSVVATVQMPLPFTATLLYSTELPLASAMTRCTVKPTVALPLMVTALSSVMLM